MNFLFFNAANQPLFTRNDAEQAEWTVEQFSFFGLFPYDSEKVIQRGQRIAFQDAGGVWQAFEIRKAKSYEPDHYQEVTAEHIAVSELTDDHVQPKEWTNQTAQQALASILTGTLWQVGNVTASGTSSGSISYGGVWQAMETIKANWNVYITPRITIGPSGITGRYLDIAPAQGNWRGLRLSIDSNLEQAGVTYDDTNLITAMYGYGKNVTPEQNISANPPTPQPQDLEAQPVTFTAVVWAATDDHPAKPAGQAYLENPTAKALYGRNGRNRFGFFQNGDVTDPNKLLELTWEALKKDSEPLISIEGTIHDLQRLGYADQTIQLHDTVIVEVLPAGVEVQREIIQLSVDLLNPLNTRVTIGAYIPNIIYINKETIESTTGGGGGNGRGQSKKQKEWSEFQTEISANQYQILLRAWQQNKNNEILRQAGLSIDANGVLVYATDNELNIGSKIQTQADRISLVVEGSGPNAAIKPAAIVASINDGASTIKLSADHIDVDGLVTKLETKAIGVGSLHVEGRSEFLRDIYAEDYIHTDEYVSAANGFYGRGFYIGTYGGTTVDVADAVDSIGPATASGGQITIPWTRLDGTAGTAINFNIADTQFYRDGVSARTAHSISRIVLTASDTGTSSQPVTVFSLDDEEVDLNVSVDASAVYAAGQAEATFDLTKLTINLGSDYDPTAQVPTKTADRISGKIGVWYDGTYYGELRTFSLSINHGTPYINNPAAGYVRGAVSINGETLMGNTIKLTESQISSWGGPIT